MGVEWDVLDVAHRRRFELGKGALGPWAAEHLETARTADESTLRDALIGAWEAHTTCTPRFDHRAYLGRVAVRLVDFLRGCGPDVRIVDDAQEPADDVADYDDWPVAGSRYE